MMNSFRNEIEVGTVVVEIVLTFTRAMRTDFT